MRSTATGAASMEAMASGFAEEIADRSMVPPLVIEASWEDKLSSFFAERVKALAASVKADWMSVRLSETPPERPDTLLTVDASPSITELACVATSSMDEVRLFSCGFSVLLYVSEA